MEMETKPMIRKESILPLAYVGIKNKERFSRTREKHLKANVQIIKKQEDICLG